MNIRRLKVGSFVELECKHFVAEGLGLSYFIDDTLKEKFKPQVFFIWGVLPGEQFIARLAQVKSKVAYGVLARIDELPPELAEKGGFLDDTWALSSLSPRRQKAACANYLRCGGCRMQHMAYEATLEYKRAWLLAQLARNGMPHFNVEFEALPENARRHYRNHVQVHLNKFGVYGFYEPLSYRTRAFPEHGCLIFAEKELRAKFPRFPVEVRAVRIRLNTDGDAVFSALNSAEEKAQRARYTVAWPPRRKVTVEFPVTCFFQANLHALPAWLSAIEKFFLRTGISTPRVLELFSGFGFISRMLSLVHSLTVFGVDILPREQVKSVVFSENGSALPDDFSARYHKVDLFLPQRIAPELEEKIQQFDPQILLINPPRAGLLPATWQKLRERALHHFSGPIIYSSCDAATMARDLAYLRAEGYRCVEMQAFDFFAWTQHYETVSYLVRG